MSSEDGIILYSQNEQAAQQDESQYESLKNEGTLVRDTEKEPQLRILLENDAFIKIIKPS